MGRDEQTWQEKLAAALSGLPSGDDVIPDKEEVKPEKKEVGRVDVILERKGRGGKTATIVTGLGALTDGELLELASRMKSILATGGSARGGEILIQGDRRDDVVRFLNGAGYKARKI